MKKKIFQSLSSLRKESLSSIGIDYHKKRIYPHKLGQIFFKNLSLMLVIVTVPLLVIAGISCYTIDRFLKSEMQDYSAKFAQSLENVTDRVIDECISQMNYMVYDSQVSVFLCTDSTESDELFYDATYLFKLLKSQLSTREYLHSIYVYSDESGYLLSPTSINAVGRTYDTNWLDSYNSHPDKSEVWIEIRENRDKYSTTTSKQFLSIYMPTRYGQENTGLIVYNIDWDKFCTMIINDSIHPDDALAIIDADGKLVTSIYGDCTQHLDSNAIHLLNQQTEYVHTGSRVLYKTPFSLTDWNFVLSVPLSTYESNIQPILSVILIIILVGIISTLIIAFFISLRIYRPFGAIIDLLQKPVGYVENEPTIRQNEETFILDSIRNTIQENEKIGAELQKRIALLKKAQHAALQSQINPHFLYNTLDAINWMVMRFTGGRNEASIMISKLAAMLRYSLEDPESMVSMELELNNVRTYLELQNLRYKGQFSVEWDIEEGLENYRVIKLMLQPIVENSIYHGLRPLHSTGIIRISVRKQQQNLIFEIEDTGVGIEPKQLEQINQSLSRFEMEHEEHIGIQNVNQRIQLFFGESYGIHIESQCGKGTNVIIKLPLVTPEND